MATVTSAATVTTLAPSTTIAERQRRIECVQQWPLRDRIALMVWPSVYPEQWASAESVVRDLHVGGVLLMKPDDQFASDLAAHLAGLDAVSSHGVVVATDEEGGSVQRLSAVEVLPSQQAMSALTPTEVFDTLSRHARLLAGVGIDVVLGPVVDVRPLQGSDPLGHGRLFAGGPEDVAALADVYVRAWQSAGILPVLKHFPGHGSASADTHSGSAITPSLDVLRTRDLLPFAALAHSGAGVMVGHLAVPGLTDGEPASLSPVAISLLRDELGYGDALVMTDALGMAGVGVPVPQAAVRAVVAGVDVVIFTSTGQTQEVIDAIEAAVNDGTIPVQRIDESAARVLGLRPLECRSAGTSS